MSKRNSVVEVMSILVDEITRLRGIANSLKNYDSEEMRNRLAVVIAHSLNEQNTEDGVVDCHPVAEAVMKNLGLPAKQEWGLCERGEDEPGSLNYHRASLYKYARDGDRMMTRWITDWVADE